MASALDFSPFVAVIPFDEHVVPLKVFKAVLFAMVASSAAILYSEILYQGTKRLYLAGKLQRYYPLPQDRHVFTAWTNAMSFTVPAALWAIFMQPNLTRSFAFNPISILAHLFLYMAMHDVYFYLIHSTFHRARWLYNYFHAMHHEYVYAMNVYMVGYAEVAENFLQVGVPWITWTAIAGGNWFNWFLPLSVVLFTTLLGHSGYRMNWRTLLFHPLILPVVLVSGKHMLTPGDHQVHHTYRRYNFGLFWRFMDKMHGTYKKPDLMAHDVTYWAKWAQLKDQNSEEARKWMGKQKTDFAEVEWGF